jgi:hypothetical protein
MNQRESDYFQLHFSGGSQKIIFGKTKNFHYWGEIYPPQQIYELEMSNDDRLIDKKLLASHARRTRATPQRGMK